MSTSFTNGTTTVQPLVIDGWTSARTSRNVVQDVMGGGTDAMLYPAAPRSGQLSAIFLTLADAVTFETMLAGTALVTFGDSDNAALAMTFVAVDDISISRGDDPITLADGTETFAWSVDFGFQQVTP